MEGRVKKALKDVFSGRCVCFLCCRQKRFVAMVIKLANTLIFCTIFCTLSQWTFRNPECRARICLHFNFLPQLFSPYGTKFNIGGLVFPRPGE